MKNGRNATGHRGADSRTEPSGFGFGDRRARTMPTFHPAEKQRVSFVWWRRDLEDASPMFREREGRILTLVAVWPMRERGLADARRLDEVQVKVWEMTDEVYAHLEARHRLWHLGRYDLVVWAHDTGIKSVPTLDSGSLYRAALRSERDEAAVIQARIDEAVKDFTAVA